MGNLLLGVPGVCRHTAAKSNSFIVFGSGDLSLSDFFSPFRGQVRARVYQEVIQSKDHLFLIRP